MELFDVMPLLAAAGFGVFAVMRITRTGYAASWVVPAVIGAAFLGWSLFAVASEGLFGFWQEHTRNAWGNQIWFDLLMAIGMALVFLVPEARRLGARPVPWVLLTVATGCIGLFAFAARVFYLRERSGVAEPR